MLLSILIPAYHEEATVGEVLRRALAADTESQGFEKEVVLCDDGSTDGTAAVAEQVAARDPRVRVLRHDAHRGEGAAIRTALAAARGTWCLLQDAELEYDAADYPALLAAAAAGADVVYGSRFLTRPRPTGMGTSQFVANRLLTITANLLYGMSITDEATALKLLRTDLLRELELTCEGFELGPEVTAKLGRRGIKIAEVPVAYAARASKPPAGARGARRAAAMAEAVRWTDGVQALWVLVKHRVGAR